MLTALHRTALISALVSSALSATVAAQEEGRVYAAEFSSQPRLRIWDVDTGVSIGNVALTGLVLPTDFASAPDGAVYAVTHTSLRRIDPLTGGNTTVASLTSLPGATVGLDFTCEGGAVVVTSTGSLGAVDVLSGQVQLLAQFPFGFAGDVATVGGDIYYAAVNASGGSRLARLDLSGATPTSLDLGVIVPGRNVFGLDFDGFGRLIATDDALPGRFWHVSNLGGPLTVTFLSDTSSVSLNGPIAGIATRIASGQQQQYCNPSSTSCGATPTLSVSGIASASASSGFTLSATNVRAGVPIALWYSVGPRTSTPFGAGSLCLSAPRFCTPPARTSSAGAACDGSYSIDLNTFARGLSGGVPQPFLSQAGVVVRCQFVGRDPSTLILTEALEFSICN